MSPVPRPAGPSPQTSTRRLVGALSLALTLAALALVFGPARPRRQPAVPTPSSPASEADAPLGQAPALPLPSAGALAAALGEEQVALDSSVSVEAVEQDSPWACAGEPLGLFARLGGEAEPGALTRWLWQGATGVELAPGATLTWRAPLAPGPYVVRVQICKDLGGRRVGVLAERAHTIDVRRCDTAASRGELRLLVTRLAGGAFAFEAARSAPATPSAEGEVPSDYLWDFDDGTPLLQAGPRVEHAFTTTGLGPQEVRAFAVRASTQPAGAEPLEATAFAVVRGRPTPRDAPPVELEVSRPRPAPEGGWQSALHVRVPPDVAIRWHHVERIVQLRDDRTRTASLPFAEAVRVDEHFERGGFRGDVLVRESDVGEEVKQVHDFLQGRDEKGREVVVSWTPFKRQAPASESSPQPAGAAEAGR